ncbi:MAG: deoxyribonuclease IV [Firmicutes bacterium]|jgi:deoxyribonuclease-4|nr:deoxyribonuclease IV [Bacillota bacterium]
MIIGAHLTIAKGMPAAIELAKSIDGNAFQFFTRNPRGGRARHIGEEEIAEFRKSRLEAGIKCVVGHMPYTINLATNRPDIHDFGKETLREDLERFAAAEVDFLVVHPGSHLGDGVDAGIERIVDALTFVFERYHEEKPVLLLETMAGHGTEVGRNLQELREVFLRLYWPEKMGVCLDSCHLLAAGYDLTNTPGIDQFLEEFDALLGLERMKLMHLNDSKQELGSSIDRHAKIGEGALGMEGIQAIVNHSVLGELPFILESPVDDYPEYGEEIRKVLKLRQPAVDR